MVGSGTFSDGHFHHWSGSNAWKRLTHRFEVLNNVFNNLIQFLKNSDWIIPMNSCD